MYNLVKYKPFSFSNDDLFNDFFTSSKLARKETSDDKSLMAVTKTDTDMTVRAPFPGIEAADISAKITEKDGKKTLVLSVEKEEAIKGVYSSYKTKYVYALPSNASTEDVQASYKLGEVAVTFKLLSPGSGETSIDVPISTE